MVCAECVHCHLYFGAVVNEVSVDACTVVCCKCSCAVSYAEGQCFMLWSHISFSNSVSRAGAWARLPLLDASLGVSEKIFLERA